MSLQVKSIFGPTIQGEGKQSGLAAIFVRFAGCNMWNGEPETRAASACPYCDTDFLGGEPMTVEAIVARVNELRLNSVPYLVVLTGGEPMLQDEEELVRLTAHLKVDLGCKVQVETNGTKWLPRFAAILDFVTVSPKVPFARLKVQWGRVDCLKLLVPHPTVAVEDFLALPHNALTRGIDFCLQPIEPPNKILAQEWDSNEKETIKLVKKLGYPWRLSLQIHKTLGEE